MKDEVAAATIAGSDSSGGAGIAADLATFTALGVAGRVVLTAVTAQTDATVQHIHLVPFQTIAEQIDAVVSESPVGAWKTAMMGTADRIAVVVQRIEHYGLANVVVDPVMVSSSGMRLLDDAGLITLRDALLPHALMITPNWPEAEVLAEMAITTYDDAEKAARVIAQCGSPFVLVKGGHSGDDVVVDVIYDARNNAMVHIEKPRVAVTMRGTGCILSAAIAAHLAKSVPPLDAISQAREHLQERLSRLQK